MEFQPAPVRAALGERWGRVRERGKGLVAHGVHGARAAATRPYRAIAILLAANLVAIGVFVALGEALFADPAEFFRELMPGTWLSIAQLCAVAIVAWAIHLAEIGKRLRFNNLWGVSVAVFGVLAFDEGTQLTIFAGDALTAAGALAPAGFRDLDAFLLTILLLASAAVILRYGRALLAHPPALAVFAVGVALGAASQTLDSFLVSTSPEFVAEESLKLAAEPFLIGGFLVILGRVVGNDRAGPV